MKCYTRQKNDGSKYTSCETKSQNKNVSNNKMPPKKSISDSPVHGPWDADQRRLTPEISKLIPESLSDSVFGNAKGKEGKKQRGYVLRVRQLPALEKYTSDEGSAKLKSLVSELRSSYDSYKIRRADKTKSKKAPAGGETGPVKTTYGSGAGRSRGSWSEQEIAITDKLLAKYPSLSPFVAGKRFMVQKSKVMQIKSILKGKEDNDLFDKMIALRNERKKQEKEGKAGSKAPAKAKMKKEDEVRPASKPAPKKVSVSYRIGSGPMKTAKGIVGKTSTSRKVVATKKPVVKKPDRRKSSAPMKNAKTAPKKIARFDMASGRTGNAVYEALGEGLGIPRYGNVVTPGQVMLKRNRRK